ncbi:ankyrin protein [Fusarium bulbicola]|nr:ankyrin protein [Fusarium bulbicola]
MTLETAPEPRTHDDYHVGWVCALPTEQTAAIAILDQSKHSVIIACLPKGKIGNVSAATVTTNIISIFTNIKFCLMVSIGSGIPPKVRLGHVVVSTPVKHDLTGSRTPDYLEELEKRWPRLAPKYLRSNSLKDQLFKANYRHISKSNADKRVVLIDDQEAEESDAEDDCRFCDTGQTDSIFRDKLNTDLGGHVLCVEMEAVGLAHNFPCITSRVICDYADSHKNKAWQAHAAAIAAAFAKELLSHVQASDIEREPTAEKVMDQIHEIVLQCDTNIGEVKRKMDRKEDVDILEWLTPVNYGPQQSDNFSQRQEGTGEWLLSCKEFQDWVDTRNTLFCPGVPGAGKTIITSIVINELTTRFGDDNTVRIAYIYGNYRPHDVQRFDHLLESLLKQLVQGQSSIPASLKALYDKHNFRKTRASVEEVSATIHSVVSLYSRIFVVIDALDELKETDGSLNRFLEEIFKFQSQCGLKLSATSRFIPEIVGRFDGSTTINIRARDEDVRGFLDGKISQSGQLLQTHREMIKTEIAKAVDGMFLLAQLHFDFVSTKLTLKQIKAALNSLSSGPRAYDVAYEKSMERIADQKQSSKELAMQVLLWITCAKRVLTTLELQHALAVEEGDTELDNENLYRIEDMVSVCSGLVTVDEESVIIRLVHYTTQDYLDRTRDKWFPIAEPEITMACIRYLSFDTFKGKFCTIRDDYKNLLLRNPFYMYASHNWGHHALMASMDGYKVILDFLESPAKLHASVQAIMASRPNGWGHIEDISQMATEVPTAAYFGLSKTMSTLLENGHLADSKGVVRLLLSRGDIDPNSEDTIHKETPLSWAAKNGHATIVKLLLEKEGISADHKGQQTPLSVAARNGHAATVRLLLSRHDVDPNSTDQQRRTPLSLAAGKGHTAVVKLLLKNERVLADYADGKYRTPLSFAAENGHEAVVRFLLAIDTVDANRESYYYRSTPLEYSVDGGHERVVELLLTKTRVSYGGSLLGSAASKGYEKVLALLANSNTIPDRQGEDQDAISQAIDKEDKTLHWAAENGQLVLVEALLQKGAAIDAYKRTERYWDGGDRQYLMEESKTALHLAAGNGHKDTKDHISRGSEESDRARLVQTTARMVGARHV